MADTWPGIDTDVDTHMRRTFRRAYQRWGLESPERLAPQTLAEAVENIGLDWQEITREIARPFIEAWAAIANAEGTVLRG